MLVKGLIEPVVRLEVGEDLAVGLVPAAAVGSDGTTMVVVGATILNRGEVPTVWVREASEAEAAAIAVGTL